MLEMERHEGGETPNLEKIIPHVEYERNQMYKSTLVSQLNGYPFSIKI